MKNRMRITANRHPWNRDIELAAGIEIEGGRFSMARPVEFQAVEEGAIGKSFMTLSVEAAQQLMDELWFCGVRPSEGSGSAGQAAAMQNHLDDMRTVAFHALKLKP